MTLTGTPGESGAPLENSGDCSGEKRESAIWNRAARFEIEPPGSSILWRKFSEFVKNRENREFSLRPQKKFDTIRLYFDRVYPGPLKR